MDVLADGKWQNIFKTKPEVFTAADKRAWLDKNTDVALGSDAFFPFGDTVATAAEHGIAAIIQPGGSIRDEESIANADKAGIAMVFTHVRHFKH